MTNALLPGLIALVGLLIGSFLNVVIWRVPRGESVVSPPSHCPGCDAEIRPWDNIPVVSWLVLRGRCRNCSEPISPRYPAVELGCAVLFALVSWRVGFVWALPAFLYLAAVGLALALIDLDHHRLPDALTLPSYAVVGGLLAVAALLDQHWHPLLRAAEAGAAMYAAYFALAFAYPKGMGFGDVKLAGVVGLALGWLGWDVWAVGLFGAFLLGGLGGLVLVAVRGAGRKTRVAYGPFMLAGALVAVLAGQELARAYLGVTLG